MMRELSTRGQNTYKAYSIKVEPEALELIERYSSKGCLLDIHNRHKDYSEFGRHMKTALQKIGKFDRCGSGGWKEIEAAFPGLTICWSRHTWVTIAASLDIPKETIAAALGHGGNTVTDIYIDFDQRKVDEANRRVIDWVLYGKK